MEPRIRLERSPPQAGNPGLRPVSEPTEQPGLLVNKKGMH